MIDILETKKAYQTLYEYYGHPTLGFHRFLKECVYTMDEEARPELGEEIKKRFPYHKKYLQVMANELLTNRLLVIPKSRRMMATWLVAAYALWYPMFNERRNVLWQAQTESKSAHTLEEKMLYIMEHIPYELMLPWINENRKDPPDGFPDELLNRYKPTRGKSGLIEICFMRPDITDTGEAKLRPNSTIYGVAEGANQWRQYTVSLGVCDEFAFFLDAAGSVKGARPSVGMKGQLIFISSANPGYMATMIDRDAAAPIEELMQGVRKWQSKLGYTVLEVHYTADEEKRGVEWTEPIGKSPNSGLARAGYDLQQWQQEMEIDFTIHSGQPFYPEFNRKIHVKNLVANEGLGFVLGFDFGITPATVVMQIDPRGYLLCLDEYVSFENGIEQHTQGLHAHMVSNYPWFALKRRSATMLLGDGQTYNTPPVVSYVDPAGANRSQIDLTSAVDVLRDRGFNPIASIQSPVERMEAVKGALTKFLPHPLEHGLVLPKLIIDPKCKRLIEALGGGCKSSQTTRFRKEKNIHSHITEALEYVIVKLDAEYSRKASAPPIGSKPHVQRGVR